MAPAADLFTPLNSFILSLLLLVTYLKLRPTPPPTLPKPAPPRVFTTYTPLTLKPHNGTTLPTIYFAVYSAAQKTHHVFDVTPGAGFYGPGGPYSNFAGRDASRGLACQSFDEEMLTVDLRGPLDDLKGNMMGREGEGEGEKEKRPLSEGEWDNLRGWEERFREKYLVVGRLVDLEAANHEPEIASHQPRMRKADL